MNIEEVRSKRFIPQEAVMLSRSLKKSDKSSGLARKRVNREEIAKIFQSERSALGIFPKFSEELAKVKSLSEQEYLFFRFTESRAFLPYHRSQPKHFDFTKQWVDAGLIAKNDDLRKLYSDYYFKIKPVNLLWRRFMLENQMLQPGENLKLSAFYLKKKKHKNQTENYNLLLEIEKPSVGQKGLYEELLRTQIKISNRNYKFSKTLTKPGRYRLTLFNKYFFQHFIVTVSDLQVVVKNDGELLSAWVTSSNPKLSPPFQVVYDNLDGRRIVSQTNSSGVWHLFNDVLRGDSLQPFKLQFEKNGNVATMDGKWGKSPRTSVLLDVHLHSAKQFYRADETLYYSGVVERRLPEGGLVPVEVDSLEVTLADEAGNLFWQQNLPVSEQGYFSDSLSLTENYPTGKLVLKSAKILGKGAPSFTTYMGKPGKLTLDFGSLSVPPSLSSNSPASPQPSIEGVAPPKNKPGVFKGPVEYAFHKPQYAKGDTVVLSLYAPDSLRQLLFTRESQFMDDLKILPLVKGVAKVTFVVEKKKINFLNCRVTWFNQGQAYVTEIPVPLGASYQAPVATLAGNRDLKPGDHFKGTVQFLGDSTVNFTGHYLVTLEPLQKILASQRMLSAPSPLSFRGTDKGGGVETQLSGVFTEKGPDDESIKIGSPLFLRSGNKNPKDTDRGDSAAENLFNGYTAEKDKMLEKMGIQKDENHFRWQSGWQSFKNKAQFTLDIPIPQTGGDWVLNVSGITPQGVFSTAQIISALPDLEVYLQIPRHVTVGDEVKVKTLAINNTRSVQEGRYTLAYQGFHFKGASGVPEILNLKPKEQKFLEWESTVTTMGSGWARLSLQQGSRLYIDSQSVRVSPRGAVSHEVKSGMITSKKPDSRNYYKLDFNIKQQDVMDKGKLQLEIYPGVAALLKTKLTAQLTTQHSNSQSLLSDITPKIEYALKGGAAPQKASKTGLINQTEKFREHLLRQTLVSLSLLQRSHNEDGGISWALGSQSNPYVTSQAVHFMRLGSEFLGKAWAPRHQKLYDEASSYLYGYLSSKKTPIDLKILIANTLCYTDYRQKILPHVNALGDLPGYSAYAVALMLEVYHQLGLSQQKQKALRIITERAIQIKSEASWNGDFKNTWFSESVEATGKVLQVLCLTQPQNPVIEKIIPYLARKYKGQGWGSDKTTAVVYSGLVSWMQVNPDGKTKPLAQPVTVGKVFLNGKKLYEIDFNGSSGPVSYIHHVLPENLSQSNRVILGFDGKGQMMYSGSFEYGIPGSWQEPLGTEIQIQKNIYKISYQGGQLQRTAPESLFVGDELEVEWTLKASKNFAFVEVKDGYTSGVSYVKRDSLWIQTFKPAQSTSPLYLHPSQGVIKGALPKLESGEFKYAYYLKVEEPGQYILRPAEVSLTYKTGLKSRSVATKLTIRERP